MSPDSKPSAKITPGPERIARSSRPSNVTPAEASKNRLHCADTVPADPAAFLVSGEARPRRVEL